MSRYILLALSASLLCFGSAEAQLGTVQATTVSLPELAAADIAQDVTTQYNPRTGAPERLAPSFDPFEDADDLAADVRLRSTGPVRDLDGIVMGDGAVLDISLFYNSAGTRDFGRMRDALYLSGQPVPIVSRDSVELECSSRVTETVYASDRYYGGVASYGGLVRSRPRYYGHSGYGLPGYGYGGYDSRRGYGGYGYGGYGHYGGYGGYRGYAGHRGRGVPTHPPRRRPGTADTPETTPSTVTSSDDAGRGRPALGRDYIRGSSEAHLREKRRDRGRTETGSDRRDRAGGDRSRGDGIAPVSSRNGDSGSDRYRHIRSIDLSGPSASGRIGQPAADAPRRRGRHFGTDRIQRPSSITAPAPMTRPTAVASPRPTISPPTISKPPVSRPKVSKPPVVSKPQPRSQPKPPRELNPQRSPRSASGSRRQLELFPGDRGDAVVISSSRDCAREDRLSVFIPAERLDAARFDGLTLIVRDVLSQSSTGLTQVYDERPLYIPPNYIEGFRMALTRAGTGQ